MFAVDVAQIVAAACPEQNRLVLVPPLVVDQLEALEERRVGVYADDRRHHASSLAQRTSRERHSRTRSTTATSGTPSPSVRARAGERLLEVLERSLLVRRASEGLSSGSRAPMTYRCGQTRKCGAARAAESRRAVVLAVRPVGLSWLRAREHVAARGSARPASEAVRAHCLQRAPCGQGRRARAGVPRCAGRKWTLDPGYRRYVLWGGRGGGGHAPGNG